MRSNVETYKMPNEKCKMNDDGVLQFAICILQFAFCNFHRRMIRLSDSPTSRSRLSHPRRGGIYIVVLGTSMIVALLGMSALVLQRLQNKTLIASSDMRRAQLNAYTAIELALLTTKQSNDWRSQLDVDSYLFKNKTTAAGSSCSVHVSDAPNDPSTATADRPIKLLAIGAHGGIAGDAPRTTAAQRVEETIDPRRQPHDSLKPASAMLPDWNAVFAYYQANGTQIPISSLSNGHPVANFALGRNHGMEDAENPDPPYWEDNAPGTGTAELNRDGRDFVGNHSLRVRNRTQQSAGASHSVTHFLKPETPYYIEVWVDAKDYSDATLTWRFTLRTKPVGQAALPSVGLVAAEGPQSGNWLKLSGTLTSNDWTGELEYAWITVSCDNVVITPVPLLIDRPEFYMDEFLIREASTGRFVYKQAVNLNGIYWLDCQNENLYIERSRIRGSVLVLNPGPNSRIDYGPMRWSPHIPGYPALLVNGNFAIRATNQPLSETANDVNYNPAGFPYNGSEDGDKSDQYASEIVGLVGVSGTLTYKYTPQLVGRVIVGGNGGAAINNGSPTVTYRPDSLLNPPPPLGGFYTYRYDRRPASVRKAVQ
jgi:hypothetical protein